ncbi:hypothetical protein [Pseudonocardia sp. NPDC049635]|uniref:hypothetical protein n=1 Tax=Pseudonocardia sp. NPDC049635 TaxID=3155506 RepID=UPI00340448ED
MPEISSNPSTLRSGDPLCPADPLEAAALAVAGLLIDSTELDDADYRRLAEQLTEATLFEIVILVGYYTTLADVLRVFASDQ